MPSTERLLQSTHCIAALATMQCLLPRRSRDQLPYSADICLVTAPLLQQAATETGDAFFFFPLEGRSVEIVQVEAPS